MKRLVWFSALPLVLACSSSDPGAAGNGGASAVAGGGQAGEPAITPGGGGSGGAASAMGGAGSAGESAAGSTSAGTGGTSSAGTSGSAGTAGSAGTGGGAPVAPALSWIGRVVPTQGGARMAWPGTGFRARFNGTGAHVSLKTDAVDYFELAVDEQAPTVLTTQAGTHPYDLAKGLAAGDHTVTLWRRTEPLNGNAEVMAVTFDGTLLAPPPPTTKRLEIVGDSISVGYGVECKTQNEAFAFATENNYLTYQALTARKLGAELFTEAWSGIGVWRDVGGGLTTQMPERYLRALPNDGTSTWDFSKYVPDAVVVLLGTNDFAKGDPGQPFVDAYTTFVASLRMHYPKARQYFVVSPMLGGNNRTLVKQYIATVITTRNAAGDKNIASLEFAQPAADAWGCGHPNGATHAIMAGVLETALHADLGW